MAFAGLVGRNGSRRVALGGPVIFGTVDASRRFGRAVAQAGPTVPDRAVTTAIYLRNRVTHMAEIETDTSKLPPRTLVGEIERTRASLAKTIDEIADRVSPSNVARRSADQARERISQIEIDPLIGGAVALAAVSVTCYLIWRRLRK